MEENNYPNQPNDSTQSQTAQDVNSAPVKSNKKLFMIIAGALALLFIVLIILVAMLLTKNDQKAPDSQSQNAATSEQQNGDEGVTGDEEREIQKRVATGDPKLEYIIYEPQQNGANTTIYFAVENVCDGCESATSAFNEINGFDNRSGSYLVDDNNGKKYGVIKDEDGKVLATTNCNQMVEFGEKVECFVSFSKVPSGSTVSWVFGGNRIDNIKVQ